MAKWAIGFGLLLTALGLVGYFGSDPAVITAEPAPAAAAAEGAAAADGGAAAVKTGRSKTALIPSVFGLLLLICGTLGLDERLRKHAMHAAATVGLVGFLAAGARLVSKMGDVLSGNISRPMWFIILMSVLCLAYVLLSVRSFIQARRARNSQA
ncbi:MAG: hypothetical protein ACK5D7_11795 [Planctomycetota bacterium]|jgi:hypothetical protein